MNTSLDDYILLDFRLRDGWKKGLGADCGLPRVMDRLVKDEESRGRERKSLES